MTVRKNSRVTAEERHPKALGKYVDLVCIDGLTTAKAWEWVSKVYGSDAAAWCVKVCGDRKPTS